MRGPVGLDKMVANQPHEKYTDSRDYSSQKVCPSMVH